MTHTLANGVRICTVDCPDGATEIRLTEAGLEYRMSSGHWETDLTIPPGNWMLLGRFDEITEETWKGIVEGYVYSGRSSYQAYKNYSGKNPESEDDILNTATESARSLIHGNPVVLIEGK